MRARPESLPGPPRPSACMSREEGTTEGAKLAATPEPSVKSPGAQPTEEAKLSSTPKPPAGTGLEEGTAERAKLTATPRSLVKSPGVQLWPGYACASLGTTPKPKSFGSKTWPKLPACTGLGATPKTKSSWETTGLSSPQASTKILGSPKEGHNKFSIEGGYLNSARLALFLCRPWRHLR